MTTTLAMGIHEASSPTATMGRFPGAVWSRDFIAGRAADKTLESPMSTGEFVSRILDKVAPALACGGSSLVSFKLKPADVSAGVWDAQLYALGKALLSLDVEVIPWHEPEAVHTPHGYSPYFARIRGQLKDGNPDLPVVLCSMSYQWRPGSPRTRDAAAWAAVEADAYYVDVYSGDSFPADAILPEHPGFVRWYAKMIDPFPGRRWGIAERGIIAGPHRPQTWAREFGWLATDLVGRTCSRYLVWGTAGEENNRGWLLDEPTTAAITAGFARLTMPRGYATGPVDGTVVHQRTGVLVARGMTAEYDAFLEAR